MCTSRQQRILGRLWAFPTCSCFLFHHIYTQNLYPCLTADTYRDNLNTTAGCDDLFYSSLSEIMGLYRDTEDNAGTSWRAVNTDSYQPLSLAEAKKCNDIRNMTLDLLLGRESQSNNKTSPQTLDNRTGLTNSEDKLRTMTLNILEGRDLDANVEVYEHEIDVQELALQLQADAEVFNFNLDGFRLNGAALDDTLHRGISVTKDPQVQPASTTSQRHLEFQTARPAGLRQYDNNRFFKEEQLGLSFQEYREKYSNSDRELTRAQQTSYLQRRSSTLFGERSARYRNSPLAQSPINSYDDCEPLIQSTDSGTENLYVPQSSSTEEQGSARERGYQYRIKAAGKNIGTGEASEISPPSTEGMIIIALCPSLCQEYLSQQATASEHGDGNDSEGSWEDPLPYPQGLDDDTDIDQSRTPDFDWRQDSDMARVQVSESCAWDDQVFFTASSLYGSDTDDTCVSEDESELSRDVLNGDEDILPDFSKIPVHSNRASVASTGSYSTHPDIQAVFAFFEDMSVEEVQERRKRDLDMWERKLDIYDLALPRREVQAELRPLISSPVEEKNPKRDSVLFRLKGSLTRGLSKKRLLPFHARIDAINSRFRVEGGARSASDCSPKLPRFDRARIPQRSASLNLATSIKAHTASAVQGIRQSVSSPLHNRRLSSLSPKRSNWKRQSILSPLESIPERVGESIPRRWSRTSSVEEIVQQSRWSSNSTHAEESTDRWRWLKRMSWSRSRGSSRE